MYQMELKRKKVIKGMEDKSFTTIETDNGMTIVVECDPLLDDKKFRVDTGVNIPF